MPRGGRTPLEIETLLTQAAQKATRLKKAFPGEGYAYHTLVKVDLKRLKLLIEQTKGEPSLESVRLIVKDIEQNLFEGNQLVPDPSGYLLDAEAQLASILNDSKRVLESLHQAFDINPRNGYVGIRLARFYYSQDKISEAKDILKKAIDANSNDRKLHYEYSRLLIETNSGTPEELIYHLKKAFSEGDKNFDAKRLYGRQLYINGEYDESKKVFQQLRNSRMSGEVRGKIVYPLPGRFYGQVAKYEATYCFIALHGNNDWIHASRNNIDESIWKAVQIGTRLSFEIGFTMKGATAFNIENTGGSD